MARTKATKTMFTGPPTFPASLLFSPHGEAKCVRRPSGRGASRLARAGVLEQYVEHGKQAQRSPGGRIACFDRRVVGNAGYRNRNPRPTVLHESRNTNHGLLGTEALQSFFRPGGRFRLKVMTPLLGTKNPSAPAGDKSGGGRRATRSLHSCALWRGMGRLWRGMGGMGRPEPLSAHHLHQQQGLSSFHETRDPNHGFFVSLFTIVRHCSAKNIVPEPVPSCRPVAAFLRVVARHGRL